jgi:hypothetical protein
MFRFAAKVLTQGVEFTFMETDVHTKAETIYYLQRQRIPIRTWHWLQEWVEVDNIETYGVEGEPTEEPGWAQEIRDQHDEVDLDTGVKDADYKGSAGQRPGKTVVRTWSFFCKTTQAYYARMALERENYKLLRVPKAANNPQRGSSYQPTSPTQLTNRGKTMKRGKRPGRL